MTEKFNILTLNNISSTGLSVLPGDRYNVFSQGEDPDAILLRSFDMHKMEFPASGSLKAVARAGAGVNNIPVEKCSNAGIVVFNTPGANANAVKELVLASLLISSRKICDGVAWTHTLKGKENVPKLVEKGKAEFAGPEIMGKTIGVIGLGAIGVLVANCCASPEIGMNVLGFDPFLSVEGAWSLSNSVRKAHDLDEIYASADYISVHVPLNSNTKAMFNADAFAKFKRGARLLNFSRGELADGGAVISALKDGVLAAYVTDFASDELIGEKGVIAIPHLGASTPESEDNCAYMAATQLKDYLEYGNIKNSVNFPDCSLIYTGRKRFCVLHQNRPNIIAPIVTNVAKKNLNIDNMLNKSKEDLACTLIDVDKSDVDLNLAKDDIAKIDGVIGVKII